VVSPIDAIFHRDGEAFLPTRFAGSPWTRGALHGGPPAGLLAHAIERHVGDPEMQLARLTVDLFRAAPMEPLHVRAETVRHGRRLRAVQASLFAGDTEVTRASALLLRRSDAPTGDEEHPPPPGPGGYTTVQGIMRRPRNEGEERPGGFLDGFHTTIETRWVSEPGDPPVVWTRIPMPLIEGIETSPAMRAASLADFGNALANQVGNPSARSLSYINADITLYLHRDPVGEWLCLSPDHRDETDGVGLIESVWYDVEGRYGRGVQARLANPRTA
jgi:hypothetical protein